MHLTDFLSFWGKAQPVDGAAASSHPVAYHLLDVAAVAEALLLARPLAGRRLARLLGLPIDQARSLVVALAGLHDIGKFTPAFQAKVPGLWPEGVLGPFSESLAVRRVHTEDGFVLWDELLGERVGERLWVGGRPVLDLLAPGVFGHHGRPVGAGFGRQSARQRFHQEGLSTAAACADAMLALLCPHAVTSAPTDERGARLASWLVSGLLTVADWAGSNQNWFPYEPPRPDDPTLCDYWELSRQRARHAVREAGLVPPTASGTRTFAEIARVPGDATPVQAWAERVDLPDGPLLVVIEDVTGSGKTEAAQMLVHRFIATGRATGAYWAMPTMATANAMYARQARAIDVLYEQGASRAKPSLVLAHGQQKLHEGFRNTVLRSEGQDITTAARRPVGDEELESSIACAAFLADDRRAALLADVGAGTVDQALLAALPSKFNTVRLAGLAEKVLVVDEAHAYDAYMNVELQELLRFQAALGGSAVVLSATLPQKQRAALAQAWADGVSGGGRRSIFGQRSGSVDLGSVGYPLGTIVASGPAVREKPLEAARWSRRRVAVRLVHDLDDAIAHVLGVQRRGGAVAWVRNTVDDCLDAATRLRAHGVEPLVFHARFAQGDRQAREAEVMRLFGKDAPDEERRGRVLVATQVIEQSLDLDFDAMASDVAPVDLLVQRAGRLWRHVHRAAQRPEGVPMELVVLSPMPTDEPPEGWLGGTFARTAHVYENAGVLWRTVRTLSGAGCIETPDGLRDLVERVYGSDEVPPALLVAAQRAEGQQGAHAAAATYATLKPADGYHADAVAWVNDMRVPTRLGDPRTTVRLARLRPDGGLDPWVQAEGPLWKAWALSEVSVSANRVPPGSTAEPPFADAVARVRAGWGRWEQDFPVLPLSREPTGRWSGALVSPDGKIRHFGYTVAEGLAVPGTAEREST